MITYFSYVWDDGMELHTSLEEAIDRVTRHLDRCSDDAETDGWPEETDQAFYGELKGRVECTVSMTGAEYESSDEWDGAPGEKCPYPDGYANYGIVESPDAK